MTPPRTASELTAFARWSIVGLVAVALFINYVDRGAVPTAAHLIQDELGLSPRQLGVLFSAFFSTYSVLQIPVGWVAERYGAHRVLAAGLALWACATMLVGFAHSFTALLLLRLLLGIGESAGFPSAAKLLAVAVPVERLGIANGIVAAGYQFGPAVGAWCGGLIMVHYGWRAAFWVFGGLSLLWLLPWSRVRLPRETVGRRASDDPPLRAILRQPSLWGTALGLFSSNYVFFFVLTWLPYYVVRERGFSTAEMASLTGSAYVVSALSSVIAGWAIDRFVRSGHANLAYKSVMVAAHVGTVGCMLCIAFGAPPWALVGIFVYQILTGAASAGVYAMPQILAGPSASGRWVGIQNCCGTFAGVIAPALTGLMVEETGHFAAAFVTAALVSVAGLVGWVWMVPKLAPIAWPSAGTSLAPEPARIPLK
ncbi:MAG TPA: MFS transporter [Steroidobacteraceae bacterium]|nr:MFS transporter [Steroidobacteraceae bacterium]